MTSFATVQPAAARVFDQMAEAYDDLFTNSMIGRAQRDAVWGVLAKIFHTGDHVLELNCGTGEDAFFLARNGISVTACDASERMIRVASNRRQIEAADASIQFTLLPTERVHALKSMIPYDGVFSNFSGLNCVADLSRTAEDLAALLPPKAPLLVCLSTRFCIWEMAWFTLHGNLRKAFRRCSGHALAKMGEHTVDVYYPTVREMRRFFSPFFILRSCTGIGVTVPPSYVEAWIRRHPKLLPALRTIDNIVSPLYGFRVLGDHVLLHFERVQR